MGRRGDPYATDTLLDLLRGDSRPVDRANYTMMFVTGEMRTRRAGSRAGPAGGGRVR